MHYYESEDSAARWPDLTSLGQVCVLCCFGKGRSGHFADQAARRDFNDGSHAAASLFRWSSRRRPPPFP